ncbi:MAG: phosphoglycerate mutase family protein [Candidatus Paceibacterota bacterium]|jgi:hypothetical protein
MKNCTFVFLRHGETTQNDNDFFRELTPDGINQVLTFREKHEDFDIFISSPAMRAVQTAQIMVGFPNKEIIQLEILYRLPDPEENNILMDMLRRNKNLSLKDYYRLEKGGDFDFLMKIGIEGEKELKRRDINRRKVLIVAQSVTIQSLVHAMFSNSEQAKNIALDGILWECQAIKIVTDDEGKVSSAYIIS